MTDPPTRNRAVVFVDGNNFFHGLDEAGVHNQGDLSFIKIATKVSGPRSVTQVRYYVGRVRQIDNTELYRKQRSFVARQQNLDARISFHFGRIEKRKAKNNVADDLRNYLISQRDIPPNVRVELSKIAMARPNYLFVEKAVDVMLAVDLVLLAESDQFDYAYILSADGDYTHAVEYAKSKGKKVYALSATNGAELARVVDHFIPIQADWVNDCYIDMK